MNFFIKQSLKKGFSFACGRNNQGRITSRFRKRGHKKNYRNVDFFRVSHPNKVFIVYGFEYDPIRSAYLAVLGYTTGHNIKYTYVISPYKLGLKYPVINVFSNANSFLIGCSYFIKDLPVGSIICNVESKKGQGGSLVRSAGAKAILLQKFENQALIRLPSGKHVLIHIKSRCVLGSVSNPDHWRLKNKKAGRISWLGQKPKVRGVAINPIDHPHGGGEGKGRIGRHPVTPWGRLTKGKKTKK